MKIVLASRTVEIPDGVEVEAKARVVKVTGPLGSLERQFKHIPMECRTVAKMESAGGDNADDEVEKNYVQVDLWFSTRKQLACVRTVCSHIENMIVGVTRGFLYKMRFVYSHFPINVSTSGNNVEIRNFLGERRVRKVKLPEGVKYVRSEDTKDEIQLSGIDITQVSLTAAKIQQATNVRSRACVWPLVLGHFSAESSSQSAMQAGSPGSPQSTTTDWRGSPKTPTSEFRPNRSATNKWDFRVNFVEEPDEKRAHRARAAVGKLPASAFKKPDSTTLHSLGLKDTFTRGGVTKAPRVVEELKEGLEKYDLDGDGIISAEEIEAAFAKYGWEADFRVWVMGRIGTEKLVQLECAGLAIKDCRNVAPPSEPAPPVHDCRLHCQSPGWLNCGGKCFCEAYDPHLLLPLTSFSKLEISIDIHVAARQLLEQCGLELKDENNKVVRSDDFVAVIDELPKPAEKADLNATGRMHATGMTTATSFRAKAKADRDESIRKAFSICAPNGGHLVCYRLRRGDKKLRSSFSEQVDSGVVSKEELSRAPLTITEYKANEILLPHLLKFCEEYRAVKVGQALEAARIEAETRAREPWRAKGRKGEPQAAVTSAGSTGKAWIPSNLGDVSMRKTMPSRFDHAYEGAPSPDETLERPKVLCICGHGELWHKPSKQMPRRPRAIEDDRGLACLPCTDRANAPSRALPVDNAGRATIRGGKLMLARAGTAALQHSASAPSVGKA